MTVNQLLCLLETAKANGLGHRKVTVEKSSLWDGMPACVGCHRKRRRV